TDGTINVTGTVGGLSASGQKAVTVTARDWSAMSVQSNHTTPGADGLPVQPTAFNGQLGLTSLSLGTRTDFGTYASVISDGGPNDGYVFMVQIPWETFTRARVNYPAMTQGSSWYNLQYANDVTVSGVAYCGQARVLSLVSLI